LQLARSAQDEIDEKTKPVGSLGRLESLALQIAVAQNRLQNLRTARARLLLFAGDHGIAAEGVSAYPQDVTKQMVSNIGMLDKIFSPLLNQNFKKYFIPLVDHFQVLTPSLQFKEVLLRVFFARRMMLTSS
jgi:NaMN:DMB phosphoribosyltransferase